MEKLDRLREGIPEEFHGTLQKVETLRSQRRRYNDVSFVDRKYLYLVSLQQLLEQGVIRQTQADCCRDFIVSSSFFDAKSLLQYAPHYYCGDKLDLIRSDYSRELSFTIEVQPSYRSCCRFIQLIALSLQLSVSPLLSFVSRLSSLLSPSCSSLSRGVVLKHATPRHTVSLLARTTPH